MEITKQKLLGGNFAVWLVSKNHPINFAMTARVRGTLTPDQFQQAIDKIRLKYPPLSTRVIRESSGNAYLIPDANLEFPVRIVERIDSEIWVEEVTKELVHIFDLLNEPPIRFVWLRDENVSELIFVCPHALADGFSAAYLARDFLTYLGDPEAVVESMSPVPQMSDLIPDFPGKRSTIWRSKLKAALYKLMLTFASKKTAQSGFDVDADNLKFSLIPWELTPGQTSALLTRCRTENTTVHAALCAAFLRAFGEFHGDSWNRKIQSPVSLRERLTQPVGESFGLYISLVEFFVNCALERDFWEVAREIKACFNHHADDKHVFSSVLDLTVLMDKLAPVITPEILVQTYAGVEYDLSITNLGRLDIPTQFGSLQLEAFYGPSISAIPDEIILSISTVGGKMYLNLIFTNLKLDMSQAEEIKAKAMNWLAQATGW